MALNGQYGIGLIISAKEAVSGAARQASDVINGLVGSFSSAFGRIRREMVKTQAGVETFHAGLNILKKSFNLAVKAGDVEQELVAVQTIMGVSTKKMRELELASTDAGMKTQFSSLQAAQALRSLAQAGLDADSAVQVLRPSLDLAAASLGKLSPQNAAGVANATLKAFGMQAGQTRQAMNALVNMTNRFNVSVEQIPIGVANLSRGTIALKQGMDDSLIALGLVKNFFPQISKAATLTSSGMLRIADPSIQKQFQKLGITYKDQQGNFLPFIEIMRNMDLQLSKKFPDAAQRTGVAVKLLGKQGLVPFNVITKQLRDGIKGMDGQTYKGADAIKYMRLQFKAAQGSVKELIKLNAPKHLIEYAKEVRKSGGASGDFVSKLLGTFKGQVTLLQGAYGIFLETIGKPFSQVLKPFVKYVYDRMSDIIKFIQQMDPVTKRWIAGFVLGTGAAIMLWGAFVAIKVALAILSPFALGLVLALGKLLLVAAAIGAVGYVVWRAWQQDFLGLKSGVMGFFEGFMSGFNAVKWIWVETWPVLKAAFVEVFKAFNSVLDAFGIKGAATGGAFKSVWVVIGQVVGGVLGVIIRLLGEAISFVARFIGYLLRAISLVIKGVRYAASFIGMGTAKDVNFKDLAMGSVQSAGQIMGIGGLAGNPNLVLPRPSDKPALAMASAPVNNIIVKPADTTIQINGRDIAHAVQNEQNDMKQRAYQAFIKEHGL